MVKLFTALFLLSTFFEYQVIASTLKILGKSSKIPIEKMLKTEQWRAKVEKMAEANPGCIVVNGSINQKTVALTFDDGPDAKITPLILDVLKKQNVKASFFFIGNQIDKHKKIVARAHKEGHLVLNHSWNHRPFSRLTKDEIKDEIKKTESSLNSIIGTRPLLMRLPYGDMDDTVFKTLKKLKYKLIFWSLDTYDWSEMQKDKIIDNVIQNVRPGEIILMHSNSNKMATYKALPPIIKRLKQMGYGFATVYDFALKIV